MDINKHEEMARPEAVRHSLREELMEQEDDEGPRVLPTLPMKSGGKMELVMARLWEDDLRRLLEKHPEHFRALHEVVEGQSDKINGNYIEDLKKFEFLKEDGSPNPDVAAVMKAAFRETPDGPCIVDPIELKTRREAAMLQNLDDRSEVARKKGMERLKRLLIDDQNKGKGRT